MNGNTCTYMVNFSTENMEFKKDSMCTTTFSDDNKAVYECENEKHPGFPQKVHTDYWDLPASSGLTQYVAHTPDTPLAFVNVSDITKNSGGHTAGTFVALQANIDSSEVTGFATGTFECSPTQ